MTDLQESLLVYTVQSKDFCAFYSKVLLSRWINWWFAELLPAQTVPETLSPQKTPEFPDESIIPLMVRYVLIAEAKEKFKGLVGDAEEKLKENNQRAASFIQLLSAQANPTGKHSYLSVQFTCKGGSMLSKQFFKCLNNTISGSSPFNMIKLLQKIKSNEQLGCNLTAFQPCLKKLHSKHT